jgi:hypothetical protein
MMVFLRLTEPPLSMPPPTKALSSEKVQLVMVSVPLLWSMPPPASELLPEKVLVLTVSVPWLKMVPPFETDELL